MRWCHFTPARFGITTREYMPHFKQGTKALNLECTPWWWHGYAETCRSLSHIINAFSWFLNENSVTVNEFLSFAAVYLRIPFLWETTLRQLLNTALYPRNPQLLLTCTHWLIADFSKSTSNAYTKLNFSFPPFSSDFPHTRYYGYTAMVSCAAPFR
jgi:hypothetical protein